MKERMGIERKKKLLMRREKKMEKSRLYLQTLRNFIFVMH